MHVYSLPLKVVAVAIFIAPPTALAWGRNQSKTFFPSKVAHVAVGMPVNSPTSAFGNPLNCASNLLLIAIDSRNLKSVTLSK